MKTLCSIVYTDTDPINACLQKLAEECFCIVALDGRDGSGKTTLGHYLALRSGRQFLDADLYLKRRKAGAPTHTMDLAKVLSRWKRLSRPIILAGIFIGETLSKCGFPADLVVRVIRVEQSGNDRWSEQYDEYERAYVPAQTVLPTVSRRRSSRKEMSYASEGGSFRQRYQRPLLKV